jgi:prepilin peptidase CpaA
VIEDLNLTVADALLGAAIAISVVTDVRTGKILNMVTFPLMAVGVLHALLNGTIGQALVGFGVATAIHFPLWFLRIERGGDAKLMMGIGTFMGAMGVMEVTGWFALAYIPVGLGFLAITGKLGGLKAVFRYQMASLQGRDPGERPPVTMLKTAPVIAAAWLLARFTPWLDFGG